MSRTIGKRSLLASLVLAGALAGCATRTRVVYVPTEPPPPVREVISVSPGAGYVWIPGHHAWDQAARDQQFIHRLAVHRAGERQAERLERRLLAKAEHLLARQGHWRAVELIAAELLRRGSISGRSARHLFDQGCAVC